MLSWSRRVASAWRLVRGVTCLGSCDRILASFPKAGSTWVRFVLCHLISHRFLDDSDVDFALLDATMPELGVSDLQVPWLWGTLMPRVVKTHQLAWPVLGGVPAVLLVRDPRDVMVSFFAHDQGQGGLRLPSGRISDFIRLPRHGLPGWLRHTASWLDRGAVVVRYEDLRREPEAAWPDLCEALDVRAGPGELTAALSRSRLDSIRRAQERSGLDPRKGFSADFVFARKGTSGEGRAVLPEADRAWIDAELARWRLGLYA